MSESKPEAYDLIMRLPYDLSILVARLLTTHELHVCSQVSRSWHALFTDENLLLPRIQQLSHFDQEPIMYYSLPTGHESGEGDEGDHKHNNVEEPQGEEATSERMLEERANSQWLKSRRVLSRMLQKLLNRNRRWGRGQPIMRVYLPPVGLDGTQGDIQEEWEGGVKSLKMKGGIVAAIYEKGLSVRMWRLDSSYDEVKRITDRYLKDNREALLAQTKYGGPSLPPFSESDIDAMLRGSRSDEPKHALLVVMRLRQAARLFDYFITSKTLAVVAGDYEVDVYDYGTKEYRHTLRVSGEEPIGSLHVWLDYVVVGHGTCITLWNHRTGAVLEDALATAHNAPINGVFVLDDERHLMSIDSKGIMVVTNREAPVPLVDTLLDVPLYPMILAGEMGAPYAMRLLHASHLCVWGKYAFGHYEVYEPGLASLPPLSSLMLAPPLPDEAEPEEPEGEKFASNDPRATLVQLEATHREMELMYRDMASDRDSIFPEGRRIERQRRNRVPADERYHLINIDMPFEESPNGQVLCADFRRALFVFGTFIDIYDVEKRQEGKPKGAPFGIFPVDPLPGTELPPGPPSLSLPVAGADEEQRMEEQEMEDSEWVTDPSDDGVSDNDDHSVDEVDEVGEINETGEADDGRFNVRHILQHLGFGIHNGDPLQSPPPIVPPSSLNASSSILTIETAVLQSVFCLRISSDAPHDPPNESSPFSAKNLAESREFLGKYMPELLAACLARAPVDSLISAAPYYIQRLYESRFSNEPVATVDHRGERTTGQKVASDMERIMRAVGVQPLWSVPGIVSPAAVMMDFVSSAMDDSKVAVGCNNGYVVITCFD